MVMGYEKEMRSVTVEILANAWTHAAMPQPASWPVVPSVAMVRAVPVLASLCPMEQSVEHQLENVTSLNTVQELRPIVHLMYIILMVLLVTAQWASAMLGSVLNMMINANLHLVSLQHHG